MLSTSKDHLELFIKGGIVGALVGDSIGFANDEKKFKFPSEIDMAESKLQEPPGTWTASSAFAIATMQHLIEYETLDLEQLLSTFYEIYIGGYLCLSNDDDNTTCKDISSVTTQAINNFTNGIPFDKCGIIETEEDGDCLLRCWPISLYYASDSIDLLIENSHNICKITHSDIISQTYCSLFSLIIRNIILQKNEKTTDILCDYYKTKNMNEYLLAVETIKSNKLNTKKGIHSLFWGSWNSFCGHQKNSEKCIQNSIFSAIDKNGSGILSGFMTGLNNNLNDIPLKWLKTVRLESEHMQIIQNFVDIVVGKLLKQGE